jgi:hypothetical protein
MPVRYSRENQYFMLKKYKDYAAKAIQLLRGKS